MVHVLVNVLEKIYRSLRIPGCLLIFQPHQSTQRIELETRDGAIFKDKLYGPNFNGYLAASRAAIDTVVEEGLFVIVDEVVLPELDCYESVDEWIESPFLFDEEEASGVASRIRGVVKDREHRVKLFGDEYTALLRKCVIKQGI